MSNQDSPADGAAPGSAPTSSAASSPEVSPMPASVRSAAAPKKHYLISPLRGSQARQAQLAPMSVGDLHQAVCSISGVEIVKVLRANKDAAPMSAASGTASDTYVVAMTPELAEQLKQSAPPHLVVEEDHPLTYGKRHSDLDDSVAPAFVRGFAPRVLAVALRVVGDGGKPLAGVAVTLTGDLFPAEGVTGEDGRVDLQLHLAATDQARALEVRPPRGYWALRLEQPVFESGQVHEVRLASVLSGKDSQALRWPRELLGLLPAPAARGRGVKVAIIDSGLDAQHPLLRHVQAGRDLTRPDMTDGWKQDTIGHGSHCAGVVTAQGSVSKEAKDDGFLGIAPEAEIHVLRIFPGGRTSSLIEALDYCIAHGIDVANLSLGTPQVSLSVESKLEEALMAGVACIVATGNSGAAVMHPASSPFVMGVGAVGYKPALPQQGTDLQYLTPTWLNPFGVFSPTFSCHGPEVAVCAPGVGIVSTVPENGLSPDSGTSMAAPHITGLAALLLSEPRLAGELGERGPQRVLRLFKLIREMSRPVLPKDPDQRFGAGLPSWQQLAAICGLPPGSGGQL